MNQIELFPGTIDYQEGGGGGPTVVLLHGLLMDVSLWDLMATERSRRERSFVRFDRSAPDTLVTGGTGFGSPAGI